MKIAPLADVKARLSAYVNQVGTEGPVIITRSGKPVAVLLVPRDQALLGKSHTRIRAGEGLTRQAFWKAVTARQRQKS